jgi:hypothetical protein
MPAQKDDQGVMVSMDFGERSSVRLAWGLSEMVGTRVQHGHIHVRGHLPTRQTGCQMCLVLNGGGYSSQHAWLWPVEGEAIYFGLKSAVGGLD